MLIDDEGRNQSIRVEGAQESESASGFGIEVRPHLWINWATIALRAESKANAATTVEDMTLETMITVTAVRSSFHHLYLDLSPLLAFDLAKEKEPQTPELATTDTPTDSQERMAWMRAIKKVIDDRGRIVHGKQKSEAVVPHPLGSNTSVLDAYFVSDLATEAVDIMMDFYGRVLTSPSEALKDWAESQSQTLADLQEKRRRHRTH